MRLICPIYRWFSLESDPADVAPAQRAGPHLNPCGVGTLPPTKLFQKRLLFVADLLRALCNIRLNKLTTLSLRDFPPLKPFEGRGHSSGICVDLAIVLIRRTLHLRPKQAPCEGEGRKIEKSIRGGAGSRASKQAGGGGIATLCQRRTTNLIALTQALTYSFFHLLASMLRTLCNICLNKLSSLSLRDFPPLKPFERRGHLADIYGEF